jgi:hypothetical protein
VKLAALIQRPGAEPAPEAVAAINELLSRVASPEQRAAIEASALDEYVIGEERERSARRAQIAARREPSLEQFLPRRQGGLALSASDIDLYRTCPLKYKFARVFSIPQEPTINQRFGIVIHQVLERYHRSRARGEESDSLNRLMALFSAAWRRSGFGDPTTSCSTGSADRGAAPLPRASRSGGRAALAERKFDSDRPASPSRPGRPRRSAPDRRLRADRLQDRRPKAPAVA